VSSGASTVTTWYFAPQPEQLKRGGSDLLISEEALATKKGAGAIHKRNIATRPARYPPIPSKRAFLPVELESAHEIKQNFEQRSLSSMIMTCIERYLAEDQKRK